MRHKFFLSLLIVCSSCVVLAQDPGNQQLWENFLQEQKEIYELCVRLNSNRWISLEEKKKKLAEFEKNKPAVAYVKHMIQSHGLDKDQDSWATQFDQSPKPSQSSPLPSQQWLESPDDFPESSSCTREDQQIFLDNISPSSADNNSSPSINLSEPIELQSTCGPQDFCTTDGESSLNDYALEPSDIPTSSLVQSTHYHEDAIPNPVPSNEWLEQVTDSPQSSFHDKNIFLEATPVVVPTTPLYDRYEDFTIFVEQSPVPSSGGAFPLDCLPSEIQEQPNDSSQPVNVSAPIELQPTCGPQDFCITDGASSLDNYPFGVEDVPTSARYQSTHQSEQAVPNPMQSDEWLKHIADSPQSSLIRDKNIFLEETPAVPVLPPEWLKEEELSPAVITGSSGPTAMTTSDWLRPESSSLWDQAADMRRGIVASLTQLPSWLLREAQLKMAGMGATGALFGYRVYKVFLEKQFRRQKIDQGTESGSGVK